jgi:hypothetical protein
VLGVRVPTNGTFSNRVTSIQKRRGHVASICPPPPLFTSLYSTHTHIYIVFLFIYGEPSTATDLYNTSTLYGLFIKLVHLVGGPGSKEMDWLIRKIVSSQMIFDFGISWLDVTPGNFIWRRGIIRPPIADSTELSFKCSFFKLIFILFFNNLIYMLHHRESWNRLVGHIQIYIIPHKIRPPIDLSYTQSWRIIPQKIKKNIPGWRTKSTFYFYFLFNSQQSPEEM